MFNFRCVVVDTLFQFGTIHQNLIVYLFIHGLFIIIINIMLLLSNIHSRKYHILFLKSFYFGYEMLKNRPKHPQFMPILLIYFGFYSFHTFEYFSYMSIISNICF